MTIRERASIYPIDIERLYEKGRGKFLTATAIEAPASGKRQASGT
jgi:hypothetical protein